MASSKPPWAQEPQHEWTLTEIKSGVEQAVHKLTNACTVLGRAADQVDIALQHESASRQHARIAFDRTGTPWLRDLQSTHGVTVNKKRLPAAAIGRSESTSTKAGARGVVLYPGDVLQFGASTRIYCVDGPAEFARGAIWKVDAVPKTVANRNVSLPTAVTKNQEAEENDRSEGISWGIDMDDPVDESAEGIPSDLLDDDKIPEKHRKEWERLKALRYKLQNVETESERIRFKASSTELSAGQERQLERNDERIANLQEQIREKELELYRKVYPDSSGRPSSTRAAHEGDGTEEDVDDFYDRTKMDGSNQLVLDRDGETEESLIAKWKDLRQQLLTAVAEFGHQKQKVVELEQRVAYLNAKGDEESFFAQNDLGLAKDSMQKVERKKESIAKKMAEAEELLKIANSDLKPNRETGHIHRKEEILPASKNDDINLPSGPRVDDAKSAGPVSSNDRVEKRTAMPVHEILTTENASILPPPSVKAAGTGSGNFMMPPPNKKRQRVVGPAMMPPPSAMDTVLPAASRLEAKKKAGQPTIGTLAALSSMISTKTSKLGSTKRNELDTKEETTEPSAVINVDGKEDVWQAPKDQDGSGITKLNAKFAGRY